MNELALHLDVDMLANPHCHLREGNVLESLVKLAIAGGADVLGPMPNTQKGLTSARDVMDYYYKIRTLACQGIDLQVLPIVMVNEATTYAMLAECAVGSGIYNCKIYPLDRTTKSHNGVRHYSRLLETVRHCANLGMKVHLHPEHPWMLFENRDAEFAFLPIVDMLLCETNATLVWEHGTDARCILFWKEMAKTGRFFVTLTAHHLATNESEVFGDVRAVCKPPIKTSLDQAGLIGLVQEGYEWVMAGLDDAPHDAKSKHVAEGNCSCGAYTAPFGLQLYAHALDKMLQTPEGVKKFVDFTSRNARKLHNLKPSLRSVSLVQKPFKIPNFYVAGPWTVEPFWAGKEIRWTMES